MKKLYNADIFLVILLAFIATVSIFTYPLNTFPLRVLPSFLMLFLLPGYALASALYPYKKFGLIKHLLLGIILSASLTLLFTAITIFGLLTISSTIIFSILAILTTIMAFIALKRRKNLKRYIKCKSCDGYYLLRKGETLEDFESCICGGELEYASYKPARKEKKMSVKFLSPDVILIAFIRRFKNLISTKKSRYKEIKSTYLDLILIFLITIFSIFSVITPVLNESFIRPILGLLFILFLPGYSLIAALFPKMGDLDDIERAALSSGLSIAVAPLIGLGLNYTPFGIKLTSILISLSVFTISMLFIAFLRRKRILEGKRFSVDFAEFFKSIIPSFNT